MDLDDLLKPSERWICMSCKHYRPANITERQTCDAFPDGIPDQVLMGINEHKRPILGDHGLQYEQKDTP